MEFLSGSYFKVQLSAEQEDGENYKSLEGLFTSVSGLTMEVEYDTYSEGGSSFPRFFFPML